MGLPRPGDTLSHYRIEERLGEGGMGVVYRAVDARLRREVAIKVLSERVEPDDQAVGRFFAEARAASALNHPNICTVHDIGEHDGQPYLVMELLKGETLDRRLARGPLPSDVLLHLGVQMADALDAAHAAKIIHRDIKPANLLVTDRGQLKVLDFGIAKALDTNTVLPTQTASATAADPALTDERTLAGTVPYMSPEQARGEHIDQRTDIFSCGATLYEMATGRTAFAGGTLSITLDALFNRQPPPVVTLNPALPPELQGVLNKALEKNAKLRYQHISELRADLERIRWESGRRVLTSASVPISVEQRVRTPEIAARRRRRVAFWGAAVAVIVMAAVLRLDRFLSGSASDRVRSLAVLPFVNATGDKELEYLSDGLTVRLINSLADVRDLAVKSRASVFRYKGRGDDPQAAGRQLGVAALLTGSVIRHGDRLKVSAELVDTQTGNQFWGKQFDRSASEIFALEDDLARSIVHELELELASPAEQRFSRRYTESIEAYHLYLRGSFYAGTFRREGLERAIRYYQQALKVDPDYTAAYAGMAHAYFWFTDWYAPSREVSPLALDAARRALQIDDNLADAHSVLGLVTLVYSWDWPAAEREFRRALELNPGDARTRAYYAWLLAALARRDDAVAEATRAHEADPLSSEAVTVASLALYLARDFRLAERFSREVVHADPSFTWAHITLGRVLQATRRTHEAIPILERAKQLEPELSEAHAALGSAYADVGRTADARSSLRDLQDLARRQYVSPIDFATVHAGLGELEEALDWLDRAYGQRSYLMPFVDALPFFDTLDAQPRFQSLLQRLNLPTSTDSTRHVDHSDQESR